MMDTSNSNNQSALACGTYDKNDIDSRSVRTDREDDDAELESPYSSQATEQSNLNLYHVLPQDLPPVDQPVSNEDEECVVCKSSDVPMCHMKLDQLQKLKNSTKKLLCLLEEVQEKTHSTDPVPDDPPKLSSTLKPMTIWDTDKCSNILNQSVGDIINAAAIKELEQQARQLDAIYIKDEDDDCSVYKRLTRKCHCLNQQEYNDFIIHFNEETKYGTSSIGEIIKNMLIIKKFLYMGGTYTKNALLFLNQGLEEGSLNEKAEIVQACAFADLCCIFEPHTIVTVCISWPCKSPGLMDPIVQEMAAEFLHNLAKLEEGRRYLNFNSKITCAIKKLLKRKQDKINFDTVEVLNSVLLLCQTPLPNVTDVAPQSVTYQCRPKEEDIGTKSLRSLIAYYRFMTENELFFHLDILRSLSGNEDKKMELTPHLPAMITLFKKMLLEFNNSDMNLVITKIMNNIVGYNGPNQNQRRKEECYTVAEMLTACTTTEAIKLKHINTQVPEPPKKTAKKQHVHHPRQRSRPAIVLKKRDPGNKQVAVTQAKNNARQKSDLQVPNQPSPMSNTTSGTGRQRSFQDGFKSKSAPFSNSVNRSKKWEPSVPRLNETTSIRMKSAAPVYTTSLNRSRKFMEGDNKNIIVVPMEQDAKPRMMQNNTNE